MSCADGELLEDDPDLDAYIENLTKDWPPPDSPTQLAVLRRVFGPHLRAAAERDEHDGSGRVTTVQLRDRASYARPLVERLEARRRAGFVGPQLTNGHVDRFVAALRSTPSAESGAR